MPKHAQIFEVMFQRVKVWSWSFGYWHTSVGRTNWFSFSSECGPPSLDMSRVLWNNGLRILHEFCNFVFWWSFIVATNWCSFFKWFWSDELKFIYILYLLAGRVIFGGFHTIKYEVNLVIKQCTLIYSKLTV